ncbi:CDGSH iron-sulfur domain-containing protein [Magnetospirillum sulfuroxidans]|uniref:CDGSH iron-sulfur domain-containing protein n=1 Tax=Magnetospirillum sulfuroxidans TaxID=611300 RepID=A0ABS5IGA8_9PROT|nr:CDGSH iron-sulfur domain-containing protein [Magnetospirillum sulfuroxidans]MBR9973468.1 CDGSH iron-sulfur domain-containing protein [Magnetospirillum sulfuroxidans]
MSNAIIAGKEPITLEVKAGETYYWCRCGRSSKQPLCDGAHQGTAIEPMAFKPTADMKVRFCACKQSKKPPFCDGAHLDLK